MHKSKTPNNEINILRSLASVLRLMEIKVKLLEIVHYLYYKEKEGKGYSMLQRILALIFSFFIPLIHF